MKKIEAIIEPSKLMGIRKVLNNMGAQIMSVMEIRDFKSKGAVQIFRGTRYEPFFATEAKVEVVVPDELADKALLVLVKTAKADEVGGKKIYIAPLEEPFPAQ